MYVFEGQFLGKLVYVFKLWVSSQKLVMFYVFGLWAFFYKLVYVFMFQAWAFLQGSQVFLNLYAYIQRYQKKCRHFQSYIEFDFIKERILFVLGLGLWFLSKINIFVANLHLTYQSARLWHPPSLSYFAFFSDLFMLCLLRIQIKKQSYSFLNRIVSFGIQSKVLT